MEWKKGFLLVGVALALVVGGLVATNLSGSLRVSAPPQVSSVVLYSGDDGAKVGETTTITPWDEMTLEVNITDPEGADTVVGVNVYFLYSTASVSDPDSNITKATLSWSSGGGFSISPSGWLIDAENSTATISGGVLSVRFVFTPSKVARYSSSGGWRILVEATDSTGLSASSEYSGYSCSFYSEVTASTTSFSFGVVAPGVQNKSLEDPEYITLTVISNAYFKIKVFGDGWYNSSGHLVVNYTEFNSLLVDDDPNPTEATETGNTPFWVRGETVAGEHWETPNTNTAGATITIYLFVTLPTNIPPGDYTTTITVVITPAE